MDILYLDDHLVAVNKPAGLLVHRTLLDPHTDACALQLLRDQLGRRVYPVHRLDRPTSGVLVFALSSEVAEAVAGEFASRRVAKTYLAVVRGTVEEEGVIDYPLRKEPDRFSPRQEQPPAREAVTRYKRLAEVELPYSVGRYPTSRYSLVEACPLTGRRHQLRRHFKHMLHPIIGDTKYGEGRHNRFFRSRFACCRMLLAAVELSLSHPATGEQITLRAPLDVGFKGLIRQLEWDSFLPPDLLQNPA